MRFFIITLAIYLCHSEEVELNTFQKLFRVISVENKAIKTILIEIGSDLSEKSSDNEPVRNLKRLLNKISRERKLELSDEDLKKHLEFPLNQFRLIRRHLNEWPEAQIYLDAKNIKIKLEEMHFEELIWAASGLSLLTQAYGIPVDEIQSEEEQKEISMSDLYVLASAFKETSLFASCSSWIDAALRQFSHKTEFDIDIPKYSLQQLAYECFYATENFAYSRWHAARIVEKRDEIPEAVAELAFDRILYYHGKNIKEGNSTEDTQTYWRYRYKGRSGGDKSNIIEDTFSFDDFHQICRIPFSNPEECIYYHDNKPHLMISPIKMEIYNDNLFRIFGIFSKREIETIADLIVLKEDSILARKENILQKWISNSALERAVVELRRIDSPINPEYFIKSVADSDTSDNFVVFLNSPGRGGGLAFPGYSKIIMPEAGSVVIWNSLHNEGNRNIQTVHGICPTIRGENNVLRPV